MKNYSKQIQYSTYCSNCGKPVSKYASQCPHCGVKLVGRVWKDGINPFEEEYYRNLNKDKYRANAKRNLKNLARDILSFIITIFLSLFVLIFGAYLFKKGEKISGGFLMTFGAILLILKVLVYFNVISSIYIVDCIFFYPIIYLFGEILHTNRKKSK